MPKLAMSSIGSAALAQKAAFLPTAPTFTVPKYEPAPQYEYKYGTSGADHLNGGDGPNYISAGDGDDYIFSGNNSSSWQGSGNEFLTGASVLDGGAGNDIIQVWADQGAFNIQTGSGVDHVLISNDADFVKIDNYGDTGLTEKGDTFEFGTNFSGRAVITSFDPNDTLKFNGLYTDAKYGDWVESPQGNGVTFFTNSATGGVIEVQHDAQYSVRDVFVDDFGPNATFPYGGIMYGGEWM